MDLKSFIKEAIEQIVAGVEEAAATAKSTHKSGVAPHRIKTKQTGRGETRKTTHVPVFDSQDISFDIAVTVEEQESKQSGGQIKVLSLVGIGSESGAKQSTSVVSRVSFSVPVVFNLYLED